MFKVNLHVAWRSNANERKVNDKCETVRIAVFFARPRHSVWVFKLRDGVLKVLKTRAQGFRLQDFQSSWIKLNKQTTESTLRDFLSLAKHCNCIRESFVKKIATARLHITSKKLRLQGKWNSTKIVSLPRFLKNYSPPLRWNVNPVSKWKIGL